MLRLFGKVFLAILLAAIAGAVWRLARSPDPEYTAKEWIGGSQYYAYDDLITAAAQKQGVDPMLVKAVVWRESRFRPDKVGTSGERGLMQVGEAAASDWARAEKVETFVPTDLFDPKNNLDAGVWYLRKALSQWKGAPDPVPLALAQYNAGPARAERWAKPKEGSGPVSTAEFMQAIDIGSTRRYIEDITARYRFYRERKRM